MNEPVPMEPASLTPSSSEKFTHAQHKEQDEKVTREASSIIEEGKELSLGECLILLKRIIKHSEGKLKQHDSIEAGALIRNNPKLKSALQKAWGTKDYTEIRRSDLLTVPNPCKNEPVQQKNAIENAWITEYRGEAPAALWTRIKKAMQQADLYAKYLAIVQSSGTGKSRMIEELSKKHLVIPVNLRDSLESGYPPPDKKPYAYLSGTTSEIEARVHAVAFLRAVFEETSNLITEFSMYGHNEVVALFSQYMSEGMSLESHGHQRQSFYNKVALGASKLEGEINQAFATSNGSTLEVQLASVGICEAFEKLIKALSSVRTSRRRHQALPNQEPLVILAFDEARTLAKLRNNQTWSHFSELRRALRALADQPLFSLFLTTTGNVNTLVPSSGQDLSRRVQSEDLYTSRPFAEVGFDHFAFKDQFDLRKVTEDEHISHFGRPLWATRYQEGDKTVKDRIIQFAALKLRAGKDFKGVSLESKSEKLACLAQRLPIEFHSVTYASRTKEIELVEGHMRILLRLDAGFESLATVSSSEPLLSEAAYWMMHPDRTFKAAETLQSCLEGYSIHKGDRGELLVMLLFTLARDRAIGDPDEFGRPRSKRRWCSVPDFMKALFKSNPYSDASLGHLANSKIFFNHWVKVHQYAMVNVKYLAQLMRRGAAVLCATNQPGVDGIVPFLIRGYTIFVENIGIILWQGKNDLKFTDEPNPKLFKAMDPYALGILNPGDNVPIIRIVFALASKTPCIKRVECQDGLDSCDLWVGGISPTVFTPVGDRDADSWMALLQASYGWEDVYKNNSDGKADKMEEGLRRSLNPGTAKDKHHWENWADFKAMDKIKENEDMDEDMDESMDED